MAERVQFHLDENVDPRIATALRRENIDVTTTVEVGLRSRPDDEQLDYARRSERVLVTHDEDLLTLATVSSHYGIAYCAQNTRTLGQIIQSLIIIHGVLTPEEMGDQIEWL